MGSGLEVLLDDTIDPATRARRVRDQVVLDLMQRCKAQGGNFYTVLRLPGEDGMRLGENHFHGPQAVVDAVRAAEGSPYIQCHFGSSQADLTQFFSLVASANQILAIDKRELPPVMYENFWAPGDLHHALGTNLFDHRRHLGWLGVFRAGNHPPFGDSERAAFKAALPEYRALLVAAKNLDQAHGDRGVFVLNARGDVESASPAAQAWLRAPAAHTAAAEFLRSGQATTVRAGMHLQRAPLADRPDHTLLVMTPADTAELLPVEALSRRLLDTAALAAEALTVAEIAARLDARPETVRSHLSELYDRLGIASRVELIGLMQAVAS